MFLLSSFFCISLLILRNVVFLFLLLASGMVFEYIHDRCLVDAHGVVVDHGLAHHLIDVSQGTSQYVVLF